MELAHSLAPSRSLQMPRILFSASILLRALTACIALGLLPPDAAAASNSEPPPGSGAYVERPAAMQGSEADGSGLITFRRTLGLAFLAGAGALTARGFDYKDEADAFYEAYKAADDDAEIQKLYQRTTNRDVKSQVSWALAAACGATGLRLLFTGGGEFRGAASAGSPSLSLVPVAAPRILGLRLQRRFH